VIKMCDKSTLQKDEQQASEQEFNPDDYVEENPYRNPNGHPDKLRQKANLPMVIQEERKKTLAELRQAGELE
jgi:hypothetical protein